MNSLFLDIMPLVNFVMFLAFFLFVWSKREKWTGPSQSKRLNSLEEKAKHHDRRLDQLEGNAHSMDVELGRSVDKLADEVHKVCDRVSDVIRHGVQLEAKVQGIREDFQTFKDAGCGADGCPRRVRLINPKNDG